MTMRDPTIKHTVELGIQIAGDIADEMTLIMRGTHPSDTS
jgi:hypothetical protein